MTGSAMRLAKTVLNAFTTRAAGTSAWIPSDTDPDAVRISE